SVLLLPGAIAHNGYWIRALAIILRRNYAARVRTNAEHREVVSRDVLAPLRLGGLVAPDAAHADQLVPRLQSCKLDKTRRPVAEGLVFVVGEKRPVILQTAIDTAILDVAYSHQFARLGHWQGLE